MSVNVEVHNAVSIKIEDVTRSGTTTWRSIHVTEKDGRTVSFTFFAPSGTDTVPVVIGGSDE
jgi:hypothetical protein